MALNDGDTMIPGFFFFPFFLFLVGDEAERGLCINRKSTLNIPIVFIMQTKLKKKKTLAGGTAPKIESMITGGHRFRTVELRSCPHRHGVGWMSYWFAAGKNQAICR